MGAEKTGRSLVWEANIPLLTSRFFLWDASKVLGITYVLIVVMFTIIFLATGEPEAIAPIAGAFALVIPGLGLLMFLVALLFFGNRWPCRFTLNDTGAIMEGTGRRGRVGAGLAAALGLATGNFSVAGAGLIGASRNSSAIAWAETARAKVHPGPRVISLMNGWRVVVRLHATPENFEAVRDFVQERAGRGYSKTESSGASRALAIFLLSRLGLCLAGALCVGLMAISPYAAASSILMIALAGACVCAWVPALRIPAALAMALAAVWSLVVAIFSALEKRSHLAPEVLKGAPPPEWSMHRGFESLGAEGWAFLAFATLGAIGLLFLAALYLRNRAGGEGETL